MFLAAHFSTFLLFPSDPSLATTRNNSYELWYRRSLRKKRVSLKHLVFHLIQYTSYDKQLVN